MAKGINVQMKEAFEPWLLAVRAQLAATPATAPAPAQPPGSGGSVSLKPASAPASVQPPRSGGWVSAKPALVQPAAVSAPAQPPKSGGWVSAKPTEADPMLVILDEFIGDLKTAATIAERVDTVEQLAGKMKECRTTVRELDAKYKFNPVRLVRDEQKAMEFRRIRECVELVAKYYERLAF